MLPLQKCQQKMQLCGRNLTLLLRQALLDALRLVDLTGAFGEVEEALAASRVKAQVQTTPGHSRRGVVMRQVSRHERGRQESWRMRQRNS